MMSEHQKHTEFLRHCLRHGESTEHRALDEEITQIQRDERCVQRAVWLMAIVTALAVAGICYPAVLVESFPYNVPQFILNLICALGAASLVCLLFFVCLGMVYRKKLNLRREECRKMVTRLLEFRLGKPVVTPGRESCVGDGNRETIQIVPGANGSTVSIESAAQG